MKPLRRLLATLLLLGATPVVPVAWRIAAPGCNYQFPRDHGVHPDFKTEWWYFTGQLRADDGREFGYELTWFREGVFPHLVPGLSRFIRPDFNFAHFAISDVAANRFTFAEKISRGAYGEAGCGNGSSGPLAWIDDWRLTVEPADWHITAENAGRFLDLRLTPEKPPTIEGESGVSKKSALPGHASCYYSFTRMRAAGQLRLPGVAPVAVSGETWFDHEWATNQLAQDQAGWDWFSLQFSDGSDLMLYRMRLKNGLPDPASSATFVAAGGSVLYLKSSDFRLTPLDSWKSPATGAVYPIRWRIEIPRLSLNVEISPALKNQELALSNLAYWEGLIHATGTSAGGPVTAHGYLELTGYNKSL